MSSDEASPAENSAPPAAAASAAEGSQSLSPAEQPAPATAASAEGSQSPSPARKEELLPVGEKISELDDSQSELLGRLRGLKEDLLTWRSNLDTQVTKYKVELSDIKSALNNEIEQLRTDFQELRTTLKKQQEDVSLSLKNLGLQDATGNDGSNGTGEESTNEDFSVNLGSLEETPAEDGAADNSIREGTPSDE